jgi:hypothetical protein
MQPCLTDTQQTLDALLKAMEAQAAKTRPQQDDQRAESRRPLHADCELCVFKTNGDPQIIQDAIARNLTFLGLSVVAPLRAPLPAGRPVEAVVKVPDHTNTHVAGTVAFCRQVEDNCHEVGISVKAAGPAPILMHDVAASLGIYDWFAEAIKSPK